MSWLALLTGAIKLISTLADYLRERKLMDAGAAQAISAGQGKILDDLARIQAARDALVDPDSDRADRLRDEFRRD